MPDRDPPSQALEPEFSSPSKTCKHGTTFAQPPSFRSDIINGRGAIKSCSMTQPKPYRLFNVGT